MTAWFINPPREQIVLWMDPRIFFVIAGFIPAIHVFCAFRTWMAGTGPAMTNSNARREARKNVRVSLPRSHAKIKVDRWRVNG
jgi:hypothetical protein